MDDAFGEQVQALLQGYDAVGVMEAMEALCKDRSAALRHEAAAQLHRAVRHMRLRCEASVAPHARSEMLEEEGRGRPKEMP